MYISAFARQRNILDYAIGCLWRNRLKNGGIFVVFSLVIFLLCSFRLVAGGLELAASQLLQVVPDITVQKLSAGRQVAFRKDDLSALERIYGIGNRKNRVWGYYFDESNGANYTVIGDESFDARGQIPGLKMSYTNPPEGDASPAVIGQQVKTGKDLGSRRSFSLFRPDLSLKSFQRTGTFSPGTSLVTGDLIVTGIDAARDLFGLQPDEITDVLVSVNNPEEIDTIAKKISRILPNSRVVTKSQIQKTYQASFGWRSGFGLACLLGAVAAFAIFAWDKAAGLTPEQRNEVGILKALGWQTGDVITLRLWESVIISALAFSAGYLAAWVHVLWFDGILLRPVLLGWSVLRPPIDIVPVFQTVDLLLIFALSVLPYLAATVVPAWRSAVIRPDAVV